MSVGWVAAGATLVSGAMSANAAKKGAGMQADATREANELQKQQFDETREDLAPYRGYGSAATSKLAQLLGLDMPVTTTTSGLSREQLREQLLPQFTRTVQSAPAPRIPGPGEVGFTGAGGYWSSGSPEASDWTPFPQPGATTSVDEAALNAAIEREFAAAQSQAAAARQSPDYGSLLKNFTGEDLENEPGYQFGLKQGQNALNNRLASAGSYFSGAALKAASRYNQDYAGTKFNDAFNRDSANKTRTYNFLSGAVGVGQNAAAQTGNAGQTMAGQVGANTTAMGNASAAAGIAQSNSWGNALQNAAGGYQQTQLMDRLLSGNRGFGSVVSEGMRTNGMAGYNSIYG